VKNWQRLSQKEDHVWGIFYQLFDFKPSTKIFPGIRTSLPQKKFSTSRYFSEQASPDKLEDLALVLFNAISEPGQRLYALDWQHPCDDFDPRQEMDRDEFGEWVSNSS